MLVTPMTSSASGTPKVLPKQQSLMPINNDKRSPNSDGDCWDQQNPVGNQKGRRDGVHDGFGETQRQKVGERGDKHKSLAANPELIPTQAHTPVHTTII